MSRVVTREEAARRCRLEVLRMLRASQRSSVRVHEDIAQEATTEAFAIVDGAHAHPSKLVPIAKTIAARMAIRVGDAEPAHAADNDWLRYLDMADGPDDDGRAPSVAMRADAGHEDWLPLGSGEKRPKGWRREPNDLWRGDPATEEVPHPWAPQHADDDGPTRRQASAWIDARHLARIVGWETDRMIRLLADGGIAVKRGRFVGTSLGGVHARMPEVSGRILHTIHDEYTLYDKADDPAVLSRWAAHVAENTHDPSTHDPYDRRHRYDEWWWTLWIDAAELARLQDVSTKRVISMLRKFKIALDRGRSVVTTATMLQRMRSGWAASYYGDEDPRVRRGH